MTHAISSKIKSQPRGSIPAGRSFQIPSLDGIRAIAVMIVFVAHAGLDRFVPAGFGVTVFFFLSGYLITTLLRREFEQTDRISIKHFYLRRVLRIFPPMYLYLAFVIGLHLAGIFPLPITTKGVFIQCLFLANYQQIFHTVNELPSMVPSGSRILWSLAVEEHFYLFFPFFFVFCRRCLNARNFAKLLLGICLGTLIWRCVLVFGLNAPVVRTYVATDTRIDSILFGCVMAVWGNPALDRPLLKGATAKCVLLLVAAGALAFTFVFRTPGFRETFRYSIQGLALMPIFYLAISEHDWPIFSFLNWSWMRLLGLLSYSIYLFHFSLIYLAQKIVGHDDKSLATGIIALSLTLSIAYLIHRLVERPLSSVRKKLH